MSLINQMLKDLDRRRKDAGTGSQPQWPPVQPPEGKSRYRLAVLGLLVILIVLVPVGWLLIRPQLALEKLPAPPPPAQEIHPDRELARETAPRPPASPPAGETAALSPAPVLAELPAPRPPAKPTVPREEPASPPPAEPQPDSPPASPPAAVAAKAVPPPRAAAERKPLASADLIRTPRAPTPARQAKELLLSGQEALRENRPAAAEAALRRALELDPRLLQARRSLAGLLLGSGRLEEAEVLLGNGLALAPTDPVFRQGYARLLVERGEAAKARELLLLPPRPEVRDFADYYALLAVVHQELGDHAGAAEIYRRLVELRPWAGPWWLGLAAALEGSGARSEAREAYRMALQIPDLPAPLRRFALKRLEDAAIRAGGQPPEGSQR